MGIKRTAVLVAFALLSLPPLASTASADRRLGGNYSKSGLVLPRGTLRLDAGPRLPMDPTAPMRSASLGIDSRDTAGNRNTLMFLNVGATVGLSENLEVGVLAVPLLLAPDTHYGDPLLHGTYRLRSGELETGIFVGIDLPVQDDLDITAGLPLALHVGNSARVDLAALLHVRFNDESPVDLMFPFELAINVSQQLFLGPGSGIMIANFDEVLVPLGFFVGYSLGHHGDLRGEFRLPSIDNAFDRFQLLFRAEFFFDL